MLLDAFEHGGFVEFTGDGKHRVVRLVVTAVKILQPFDGDIFDIRARTNTGFAVVMPAVSRSHHPLHQYGKGIVFRTLKFVAHHRHFAVQILSGDKRVNHPIRFQAQRPVDVVVGGSKGLVVISAIDPGGAVGFGAAGAHLGGYVWMVLAAFEQQVLKQMRHAGFAIIFVLGADFVSDINGSGFFARIGKQQHRQPVLQPVFSNAFNLRDLTYPARQGNRLSDAGKADHQ